MIVLPVGQWRRNLDYYRRLSDETLIAKNKEATDIWFGLLVSDQNDKSVTHYKLETIAFWQYVMDCTESLLKERSLNPDTKRL